MECAAQRVRLQRSSWIASRGPTENPAVAPSVRLRPSDKARDRGVAVATAQGAQRRQRAAGRQRQRTREMAKESLRILHDVVGPAGRTGDLSERSPAPHPRFRGDTKRIEDDLVTMGLTGGPRHAFVELSNSSVDLGSGRSRGI